MLIKELNNIMIFETSVPAVIHAHSSVTPESKFSASEEVTQY